MINEAKASSGIENIVTTHDEIYKAMIRPTDTSAAAKEVVDYRTAIWQGYELIKENFRNFKIRENTLYITDSEELLGELLHV